MLNLSWTLPLALALAACKGGETDETGLEETGTEETDVETDVPFAGIELTVQAPVGVNTADLVASAFLLHVDNVQGFGVIAEHESAATAFDGAASVVLQVPDLAESDIGSLFDGYQGAMWVMFVFEDEDGNATQGPTERIVGVSSRLLTFITTADTGTPDIVLPTDEWSAIAVSGPEDVATTDPASPFPIDRVLQRDTITFGGTIDNDIETLPNLRLTTLSGIDSPSGESPIEEAISGSTWEATLDAPLSLDRMDPIDADLTLQVGIEVPFAYTDDDTSGDFLETADTLRAAACFDDVPIGLMFVEDIVSPADATVAMLLGLAPGWNAVLLDGVDGFTFIPDTDLDALDLSDTCPFPS